MEENYQNNVENNVESVDEVVGHSETINNKKEIVIDKKYVIFYLKCLLFSLFTIIIITLITCHFEFEENHFVYEYDTMKNVYSETAYYPEGFISSAKCNSIFSQDNNEVYRCNRDEGEFIQDGYGKYIRNNYASCFTPYLLLEKGLDKNNPINYIYLFFKYIFSVIPFYYYILFSLIYIPILYFVSKYKIQFK